ncbi:hypothetical protein [Brachybacterium sp.]|uniref:hypothetical protein n=1 Tax=Brachybacterium sp. TaxID=1891286 RepID=UPI002ED43105
MKVNIPDDDSRQLSQLLRGAEKTRAKARGQPVRISAVAWVRGAIAAARKDKDLARRIAEQIPDTRHGGARPGAGRPRGSTSSQEEM